MFQIKKLLILFFFLSSPIGLFAARISGGGGSGSGGGGGITPGATYYVRAAAVPAVQSGSFYISSGTIEANDGWIWRGTGGTNNSQLFTHFVTLPRSGGFGPQEQEVTLYNLADNDAANSTAGAFALTSSTVPLGTGVMTPAAASGQSVSLQLYPLGGADGFGLARYSINGVAYVDITKSSVTINNTGFTLAQYNCSGNTNGGKLTTDTVGNVKCSDDTSGAGGGSGPIFALGVTSGTTIVANVISTPTYTMVFDSNTIGVRLIGGNTAFMTLNGASVTLMGGTPITFSSANANFVSFSSANANLMSFSSTSINFLSVASAPLTYQLRNTIWPGATFYLRVDAVPTSQAGAIYMASGTITQAYASTMSIGVPIAPFADNPLTVGGTVDDSMQVNIENNSSGTGASSDLVLTSNLGTNTSGYVDLGINNGSYSQSTFSIVKASDAYLYNVGGSLAIGVGDTSPSYLRFFTGGTLLSNERMHISTEGIVMVTGNRFGINGTTATWNMASSVNQVLTSDGASPPTYSWQTPAAAAGGGGSTLGVSSGTTIIATVISSPTATIIVDSNTMGVRLIGGSTAFITLNPASVTLLGSGIIPTANMSPAATFYAQVSAIPASQAGAINMSSGSIAALTVPSGGMNVANANAWTITNASFTVNIATEIIVQNNAGVNFNYYQSSGITNSAAITYQSSTLAGATNYVFQIGASETWGFDCNFVLTGVSGGTEFGINGPSGATTEMLTFGATSAVGTFSSNEVTALNTADTVAYGTGAAVISPVRLRGTITNSTTAGTVPIMWKSVTNTNTSTIRAGSDCYFWRFK